MGKSSPNFCGRDGGTVYRYGAALLSSDNGTATYLYVLNGHGDVTQMLAGTTVVKSYIYDAFGNEIGINTADTNPFRYCAQYFDKESGTIYLRARYYAPGLGRFTQQDVWTFVNPATPSSLNLYIYCYDDPIRYEDYSGNIPVDTIFDIASAVGSAIELCAAPSLLTAGQFLWDLGSIFIPYMPGSYVVKAGKLINYAGDAADAIKLFDKANDTADAIKIVSNSQELSEGVIKLSKYGDAFDVKKETKTITELFSTLQMEKHHVISPKNQKYLEAFQRYTTKYNIDLNGSDNIVEMLHRGRHPNAYHEFILRNLNDFDIIASEMNDPAVFQQLYKMLTQQVQGNPIMLKKIFYN